LHSSNCNSDTIDGLPDWVVVEKQEYDLPKEAIRQLTLKTIDLIAFSILLLSKAIRF